MPTIDVKGNHHARDGRFARKPQPEGADLDAPFTNNDRASANPVLLDAIEKTYQLGNCLQNKAPLYGPVGSTKPAMLLLAGNIDREYLDSMSEYYGDYRKVGLPDYVQVENINSQTAGELETLLSEPNLDDRHNDAPTLRNMLDVCKKHPEVTLEGYVIGPSRVDERVTINALTVDNNVFNVDPDEENKEWVWEQCKENYNLDALSAPDEANYVDTDGGGAWRFWWD